ncbi:MAG: hypothetical protein D6805_06950 [Planctomycetota bacterium]|nr:MAG: hypothetical protein D6805_06950 [Planctomycetota bacterium]
MAIFRNWKGVVKETLFSERVSLTKQTKVFGKSETLFSKKGFRKKWEKGFLGERFSPKSKKFLEVRNLF